MAEATVVQKLNQGVCTDVLYPHPCLNFLLLFLSREKVKEILITKGTKRQPLYLQRCLLMDKLKILLNNLANRIFEL